MKEKMPLWFVKDYTNSHHVIKKQAEWDEYQDARIRLAEDRKLDFVVLEWPDEIVFEAEDGEDYIFTTEEVRH